jgi:hypothetical protein
LLLPHSDFDPDCCGYLCQVVENDRAYFVCNECSAVASKDDAARLRFEQETVEETCPHCGKLNRIEGFSEVFAFCSRFCGQGVEVTRA